MHLTKNEAAAEARARPLVIQILKALKSGHKVLSEDKFLRNYQQFMGIRHSSDCTGNIFKWSGVIDKAVFQARINYLYKIKKFPTTNIQKAYRETSDLAYELYERHKPKPAAEQSPFTIIVTPPPPRDGDEAVRRAASDSESAAAAYQVIVTPPPPQEQSQAKLAAGMGLFAAPNGEGLATIAENPAEEAAKDYLSPP